MIPASRGWVREVVFLGRKSTSMLENTSGGWQGELPKKKRCVRLSSLFRLLLNLVRIGTIASIHFLSTPSHCWSIDMSAAGAWWIWQTFEAALQSATSYHNKASFLALCIYKECSGYSLPRILATSTQFSLLRRWFPRHRLPEAASLVLIAYVQ